MDDQVTKMADRLQKDIIDVKKRLQHAEELLAEGAVTEDLLKTEENGKITLKTAQHPEISQDNEKKSAEEPLQK